jgi:hypothetical protein
VNPHVCAAHRAAGDVLRCDLRETQRGVPVLVILGDAEKIDAVANCQKMTLD